MKRRDAMSRAPALLVAVLMLTAASAVPASPSVVDDQTSPASLLSALDSDTVPSPGIPVGFTSYDMQHYYSQGRQIASNPGSNTVHFAWTAVEEIPTPTTWLDRFVRYNSWNKSQETLNQGDSGIRVSLGGFSRGGFVRIDVNSDNLCQATLQQRIEEEFPYTIWCDYFPIEGSALHLDHELDVNPQYPDEIEYIWPDIAVTRNNGLKDAGTDVTHVISEGVNDIGGGVAIPSDRIWYWRYDWGAPVPAWVGPVLIDSSRAPSYVIDADDNSGKVAVAFTSNYSTDGFNSANNVAYRESHNAGLSWIDGSALGEDYKQFATTFADPDGPQAWAEVSAAYDHQSNLHLVFIVQLVSGTVRTAIYHWSDARGTIRPIVTADYDNPGCWSRSLNLSHTSLGIGDGATPCFGGTIPNEDFLYVLYMKLGGETPEEQADISRLGHANGELYLTVSPDGGADWSAPINLTNTKTPDCTSTHPDSTCASEAWATIARDVSDIEILYIRDYEAGYFEESPWTMNKVMYLNYPGGTTGDPLLCPGAGCYCPCHGDAQCDGVINVLDVVQTVMVAFRDGEEIFDYDCPYSRTDVNCDGMTNVLDVVIYVDVAFRNAEPGEKYCDPCAP